MPHIVLNGIFAIESIFTELKPIFLKDDTGILKTTTQFISRNKKSILIDSLSIEGRTKYNFFTLINERSGGVVIRIYPGHEIKKTQGVKKILVEIAKQILRIEPNLIIGKTNLKELLENS